MCNSPNDDEHKISIVLNGKIHLSSPFRWDCISQTSRKHSCSSHVSNEIVCNVLIFYKRSHCLLIIEYRVSSPNGLHFQFMNWIQCGEWTESILKFFAQWKIKKKNFFLLIIDWKNCELNFFSWNYDFFPNRL